MTKTRALFGVAAGLVAGAYAVDHFRSGCPAQQDWEANAPPPPAVAVPAPRATAILETGDVVHMRAALSSDSVVAHALDTAFLRIDLDAVATVGDRAPVAMAMVIDRSGSMDEGDYQDLEQPTKMQQTKAAAMAKIDRLADDDMVAIVSYSDRAEINRPLVRVGDVGRAALRRTIDAIYAHGGTNIGAGMELAIKELTKAMARSLTRRLVLMSDGHANYGETDDLRLAELARNDGVSVSALGVGYDFNESLMVMIAENGGGAFHYAKNADSIGPALAAELDHLSRSAARSVDVALDLPEGVELDRVFGFPVRHQAGRWIVHVGDMAGGDHRQIVVKLDLDALPEGAHSLVDLDLSYGLAKSDVRRHHVGGLSVVATSDPLEVRRGLRPSVMASVVEAQTAQARREAATEFAGGNADVAKARIQAELDATAAYAETLEESELDARMAELEGALQKLGSLSAQSERGRDFAKQELYDSRIQMTY